MVAMGPSTSSDSCNSNATDSAAPRATRHHAMTSCPLTATCKDTATFRVTIAAWKYGNENDKNALESFNTSLVCNVVKAASRFQADGDHRLPHSRSITSRGFKPQTANADFLTQHSSDERPSEHGRRRKDSTVVVTSLHAADNAEAGKKNTSAALSGLLQTLLSEHCRPDRDSCVHDGRI